jgi:hypothetical protein
MGENASFVGSVAVNPGPLASADPLGPFCETAFVQTAQSGELRQANASFARFIVGDFGFFTLIQSRDGPA